MNTANKVHIALKDGIAYCGGSGKCTIRDYHDKKWSYQEPTCEACVLLYWINPNKAYIAWYKP